MQKPSSDTELKSYALAGAKRAAADLHAHEQELSSRPEHHDAAELARLAAEATGLVAGLLGKTNATPKNENSNRS